MIFDGDKIVTGTREAEVPSIEAVSFQHTKPGRLFRDAETFTAVRFGDDIFRLQFDLKTQEWTGRCVEYSPSQGAYFVDHESEAKELLERDGYTLA